MMLARLQRLRGSVYLEDGAITEADLTPDGRHLSPVDERAWHVLAVEAGGQVRGCVCVISPTILMFPFRTSSSGTRHSLRTSIGEES